MECIFINVHAGIRMKVKINIVVNFTVWYSMPTDGSFFSYPSSPALLTIFLRENTDVVSHRKTQQYLSIILANLVISCRSCGR